MDNKNLEILIKNRTDEIKRHREEHEHDIEEKIEDVNEEVDKADKEIGKSITKIQKYSVIWKILVIVLLIAVNILWMINSKYKNDITDLESEVVSLLEVGDSYTYQGNLIGATDILLVDNRTLINVDFVIENIDSNIHYSNSRSRVYVPLETLDFELETKFLTDYVKSYIVDINIPILVKNGINYIDFEMMEKLYGLNVFAASDGSFSIFNSSYSNVVRLDSDIEFVKTSHNMTDITNSESSVIRGVVLGVHKDLSKIITEDGKIGYVKTSDLKSYFEEETVNILNETRADVEYGDSINMTWSQISEYRNNPDISIDETISGLDAISPTWFSLNINGIVINEADFRYVKSAHDKDYDVWGLFSNSFKPNWTSEMLNDEVYRKKTIAQIAMYASLYDLDGVNIDYENMYLEDKNKFTQFIAELSSVLEEQNVVLSIAVTVPGGSDQWSKVYDRQAISKHVDYMMLMAYDEFWASSPTSGPVASIPWVVKGLEETLELVPNEKVILGIPLYMRVWKETSSSVSSKAIGIKHLAEVLEDKDYTHEYDEDNMVNYIAYRSDGVLNRIWVEDESSLTKRVDLMYKYKLPGIGTWSKEFVEDETWKFIDNLLE